MEGLVCGVWALDVTHGLRKLPALIPRAPSDALNTYEPYGWLKGTINEREVLTRSQDL